MEGKFKKFLKEWKWTFVIMICIITVKSTIFDWTTVPTGSLRPTIQDGDQITIDKIAYRWRFPLTEYTIKEMGKPNRFDIVVFDSHAPELKGKRLVKRVIGLPNDHIQMKDNKLIINGVPATYTNATPSKISKELDQYALEDYKKQGFNGKLDIQYKNETFDGKTHQIRIENGAISIPNGAKNFSIVVPENKYLMIGDNRNNSFDSRFWGFVDKDELIGKADTVLFSFDMENNYIPRSGRFFEQIK